MQGLGRIGKGIDAADFPEANEIPNGNPKRLGQGGMPEETRDRVEVEVIQDALGNGEDVIGADT